MSTATTASFWARLPAGLAETFMRFPLPVTLAAALTAYNLAELPRLISGEAEPFALSLNVAGWIALTLMIAAQIWGEASGRRLAAIAIQLAGLAVFAWLWDVVPLGLMEAAARKDYAEVELAPRLGAIAIGSGLAELAFLLGIGLAPYLTRRADGDCVWQFNHKLWVGFAAAWFGGLVFYIGLYGVVTTIETLFVVKFDPVVLERAGVLAFSLVPALLWLTLIPRSFDEPARTGADMEFTSRAVALLVKFIFIPLVYAFAAILFAYAVKVLVEGGFSEARLGQINVTYAACLAITALLAYPTRASGAYMALFWRIWPYLLIAPFALVVAALWVRFESYGVTPPRYISAVAALWFGAVAAAFIVTRSRADIRLIPGLLALLLLLASFGPWSATSLTVASQTAILQKVLEEQGILRNGRVRPAAEHKPWTEAAQRRAHHAFKAIETSSGLDRMRPWFEGVDGDPFESRSRHEERVAALMKRLEIPQHLFSLPVATNQLNFRAAEPHSFALDAPGVLAGPFYVSSSVAGGEPLRPFGAWREAISIGLDGDGIIVRRKDGKAARFVLGDLAATLQGKDTSLGTTSVDEQTRSEPVVLTPSGGDLDARLIVIALMGQFKPPAEGGSDRFEMTFLQAYVLVPPSAP